MLHAEENAPDQDVECQIELLGRNILDRAERAAEARVVEDAVEPPPAFSCRIDRPLHLIVLADLAVDEGCGRAEFFGQGLTALALHVGNDDARALFDEEPHCRGANSAGAAGDDCDLAFEFRHVRYSL
jgi:hypothetical protein